MKLDPKTNNFIVALGLFIFSFILTLLAVNFLKMIGIYSSLMWPISGVAYMFYDIIKNKTKVSDDIFSLMFTVWMGPVLWMFTLVVGICMVKKEDKK